MTKDAFSGMTVDRGLQFDDRGFFHFLYNVKNSYLSYNYIDLLIILTVISVGQNLMSDCDSCIFYIVKNNYLH